jgi:predicted RNA-binding protein with RPS1 domain
MLELNQEYQAKIIRVEPKYILVETLKEKFKGICHISEISDEYIIDLTKMFRVGNIDNFVFLGKIKNNFCFSYKKNQENIKDRIKSFLIPTKNDFVNLKKTVEKKIEEYEF